MNSNVFPMRPPANARQETSSIYCSGPAPSVMVATRFACPWKAHFKFSRVKLCMPTKIKKRSAHEAVANHFPSHGVGGKFL